MGFFKSFERSIRPKRVFGNVDRFLDKEVGIDDPGVRKAVIIAGAAVLGAGVGGAVAGGAIGGVGLSAASGAAIGSTTGALVGSTVATSGLTPREEGGNLLPSVPDPAASRETISRRFASGGLLGLRRRRTGRAGSQASGSRGLLTPPNVSRASLLDTLG